MGKFDSWLHKATLRRFHAGLNEYEIEYACGYARFVKVSEMQDMVTSSGEYKKSQLPHIIQLLEYAEAEFNEQKGCKVGKIARAGELLRAKRATHVVIPETPASSQAEVVVSNGVPACENNTGMSDVTEGNSVPKESMSVDSEAGTAPSTVVEQSLAKDTGVSDGVSGAKPEMDEKEPIVPIASLSLDSEAGTAPSPRVEQSLTKDQGLSEGGPGAKPEVVEKEPVVPKEPVSVDCEAATVPSLGEEQSVAKYTGVAERVTACQKDAGVSEGEEMSQAQDTGVAAGVSGAKPLVDEKEPVLPKDHVLVDSEAGTTRSTGEEETQEKDPGVSEALQGEEMSHVKDPGVSEAVQAGKPALEDTIDPSPGEEPSHAQDTGVAAGVSGANPQVDEKEPVLPKDHVLVYSEAGTTRSTGEDESQGKDPGVSEALPGALATATAPSSLEVHSHANDTSVSVPGTVARPEVDETQVDNDTGGPDLTQTWNDSMMPSNDNNPEETTHVDEGGKPYIPPPPNMPDLGCAIPFPGWGHPKMMEHFQKHMKAQGRENDAMLEEFVQHRLGMQNSQGEHVPLAGIKRQRDDPTALTPLEKK
jgi:hypothetical protein